MLLDSRLDLGERPLLNARIASNITFGASCAAATLSYALSKPENNTYWACCRGSMARACVAPDARVEQRANRKNCRRHESRISRQSRLPK